MKDTDTFQETVEKFGPVYFNWMTTNPCDGSERITCKYCGENNQLNVLFEYSGTDGF